MKNYKWVKPYKYTKVPVFYRRFTLLGFTFTIQSVKTRKRRIGTLITTTGIWNLYEDLLTPVIKIRKRKGVNK